MIRSPFPLSLLLALALAWTSSAAVQAQETHAEDDVPEIAGSYFDGEARRAISRDLLADYLAVEGFADAEPASVPAHLEPLAFLLRLEAEALRAGATPRLELELLVGEERLLAATERRRALADLAVSEEQVEERLATLRQSSGLRRPERAQVSHLFKRVASDATEEERETLRQEVEELRRRVVEGEDFHALARGESDSQTARHGGRLGILRPGDLPSELEEIAFGLDAGEVSEVLEGDQGFVLLYRDRVIEGGEIPVAEARERVREQLEKEARENALERLHRDALSAAAPSLDLAAARGDDPEKTVLRFGAPSFEGRRIDQGQVAILTRLVPGSPGLEKLGEEALRQLLEAHATQAVLAERARRRPLEEDLRRRLRWRATRLRAEAALRRRVEARFEPPKEAELRRYVAAHPERFERKEHYRLQVLRLGAGPETSGRRVAEVARQIETGEITFEEAARRHSDHPSAAKGGHVGWWSRKRLALHGGFVMRAVLEMEPGDIGQPVLQDDAWWIFRLHEVEAKRPMTFEEARPRADRLLGNEKLQQLQREVEAEVRRDLQLEVG